MIALSAWVLWVSHHAMALAPSPAPSPSPTPANSGSTSNGTAIAVAWIALAGALVSTGVTLIVGIRSSRAANRSATAAQNSATAADRAATVAEESRTDLEARSRREEVMRNVRWAAELAISDDEAKRDLGIEQLTTLRESPLTDDNIRRLIYAALKVVMEPIERRAAGGDLTVTVPLTAEGVVGEGSAAVPSEEKQGTEDGVDGE